MVCLYLTPHGRSIEPRLRAMLLRLQESAMEGIPEEDTAVMRGVLERILNNLEKQRTPETVAA